MKKLVLLLLLLVLSIEVYAIPVINMTFDSVDGTYNSTYSQNLGVGLNFSVGNATYSSTGSYDNSGYYTGSSTVTFYADPFQTISSDEKTISVFLLIKASSGTYGQVIAHYDTTNPKRSWSLEVVSGGNIKLLLSESGTAAAKSYTTNSLNIDDEEWHSIGFSFNGTVPIMFADNSQITDITKTTDDVMTGLMNSDYYVTLFTRGNAGLFSGSWAASLDEILVLNSSSTLSDYQIIYESYGLDSSNTTQNTYYICNGGDDANDGLSNITPFKTISKLNTISINPGDNISFCKNGLWRTPTDAYPILTSGNSTERVTYLSYGTGNKPKLYGSWNLSSTLNWTETSLGSNIWNASFTHNGDIANIVFDDYSFGDKKYLYSQLTGQGDFLGNNSVNILQLYSVGNPASIYNWIEAVDEHAPTTNEQALFYIGTKDYITIRDLEISFAQGGTEANGGTSTDISIINNTMRWIGGAYQYGQGTLRYGNAIGFGLTTKNVYVAYNNISQVIDACISPQAWNSAGQHTIENHIYEYNLADNCTYGFEYFNSYSTSITTNVSVNHNTFVNLGGGFSNYPTLGEIRLDRTPINTSGFNFTNNIVSGVTNVVIMFSDGGDWYGPINTDYNLYYNSTGASFIQWNGSNYADLATFQSTIDQEQNSIESDPLFVSGTYTPAYNSPACGAASDGTDIGALPCQDTPTTPSNSALSLSQGVLRVKQAILRIFG